MIRIETIHCDRPSVPIGTSILPSHVLRKYVETGTVLLWDYQGMWGAVPPEVLANALDAYETDQKRNLEWAKPSIQASILTWNQVVPVPIQLVRILTVRTV